MAHQAVGNMQEVDTSYVCGGCFQLFPSMDYFNYHQCTSVKDSTSSGYQNVSYIEETFTALDEKDYASPETEATMEEAVASILGEKMKQLEPHRNPCSLSSFNETNIQLNLDQERDPTANHMHIEDSMAVQGTYQCVEPTNDIVQFERNQIASSVSQYSQQSIEHMSIVDHPAEPVMEHIVENMEPSLGSVGHVVEKVESNLGNVERFVENIEPSLGNVEQMHIGSGMIVESVEIPSSNVYIYDNPVYLNRLMKDNTCGKRVRHDAPYTHRLGPWDDKSSQLLIQLLREYPEAYFILGKDCKRTEAWELIRYKLGEAGYQFTVLQIRMRWRELCKKYRNVVNHNDLHDKKRTCQYFDDLNSLFGIWDSQATLLLIQQVGTNSAKRLGQNGGTRMRYKAWQLVQEVLAKEGYEYTADQVHGRWNALVTLYRRMVEHNSNQSNEPMTVAYQDAIESVFKYVPERKIKMAKIREKQGQSVKVFQKKWTLPVERLLLRGYLERIELFIENGNKRDVWEQIRKLLEEERDYRTSIEKVRTRFYELSKQYEAMLHHNSQPGTLYRESRHHEVLAEIYSHHNCWPHDGSTMKSDNSSSLRMRQMKAQMMWSDEESHAVLILYPQVLIEHLRNGDQPPLEELWVQLAKDLFSTYNFFKQPYEIEEHIALLRQGYRSQNPFPFTTEMELLEETEHTLCFSPESPSTIIAQLVQYWSHSAAHYLLDFVIHYCQEGVKLLTENLFDIISDDMENHGYRYTAEECREYYHLLKKMYRKKVEALKDGKDIYKLYPYMKKMEELKTVMSQTEVAETDDVCIKIVSAASSILEEVKGTDVESKRESLETMLLKVKMHLMRLTYVRPPPPVKAIARSLLKFVREEKVTALLDGSTDSMKLSAIIRPHVDLLSLISQNGLQHLYQDSQHRTDKRKKIRGKMPLKSASIQWTTDNVCIMLETVREWQLLCHDDEEVTATQAAGQPLWHEVAYRLSRRFRKCPDACQLFFVNLCQDYARLESSGHAAAVSMMWSKDKKICDLLCTVLSPVGSCDAEWDIRDACWVSEAGGWSREETLELLFTVRELWSGEPDVDWELVSLLLNAGGYQCEAKCCYTKFHQLYGGYQRAFKHNQECSIRERRRPPFYFKIHSLFGYREKVPGFCSDPKTTNDQNLDVDEQEVIEVLLAGLKDMKNLVCHSVPRRPLLHSLAHYLDEQYQCLPASFTPYQVWHLLVQLHNAQQETVQENAEGPFGVDLDGLWQPCSSPLMAYGLHAVPLPGWHSVCDWNEEELDILVKTTVEWELGSSKDKSLCEVSCEALQAGGYSKTSLQCQSQWQYMVNTIKHGGYQKYKHQVNIASLLQIQKPNSQRNNGDKSLLYKQRKCGRKSCLLDSGNVNSNMDRRTLLPLDQEMCDGAITNHNSEVERNKITDTLLKNFQEYDVTDTVDSVSNSTTEEGLRKRLTQAAPKKCGVHVGKTTCRYTNIVENDKIRVKVLNITKKGNSEIVECQAQDDQLDRIIKLHYPVAYLLPHNIKFINIPRMLVYPPDAAPPPLDLADISIRENTTLPYYSTSGLQMKKDSNVNTASVKGNHFVQIQQRLKDSCQEPQKRRLKSPLTQVKKNRRILSQSQITKKKKSSRIKLKKLRRGSQLQLKKSREFLQLPFKKRQNESHGELKNISDSAQLPVKNRCRENSSVSVRRLNRCSQIEIKESRNFSQIRLKKYKIRLRSKIEQKGQFPLPLENECKDFSISLTDTHPNVSSSRKYCRREGKKTLKEEGKLSKHKKMEERKTHWDEKVIRQRRDITNLLNQYHLQYRQEKGRLLGIIKENHQEEKHVLKKVISLIEEMHSYCIL